VFYWVTIMFSQTLGTALGDWVADTNEMGYVGAGRGLRWSAFVDRSSVLPHEHFTRHFILDAFILTRRSAPLSATFSTNRSQKEGGSEPLQLHR